MPLINLIKFPLHFKNQNQNSNSNHKNFNFFKNNQIENNLKNQHQSNHSPHQISPSPFPSNSKNDPIQIPQVQSNHSEFQLSKNDLPFPTPLPSELTIAIVHLDPSHDSNQAILSKIQSRISSTGFKTIQQLNVSFNSLDQILALKLPPNTASGLALGVNLIYLLSRPRAIQVWKDLVGIEPTLPGLPARPGSLKLMFGSNSIWAADRIESVYLLIKTFWPNSNHLQNFEFDQIRSSSNDFPSSSSSSIIPSPSESNEPSPPRERRVFKFSRPSATPMVSYPTRVDGDNQTDLSDTSKPISVHSSSKFNQTSSNKSSDTNLRPFSRVPQSKASSSLTRSSDLSVHTASPTSTHVNKNQNLLPINHPSKSSSSSTSDPSSVNALDYSAQKSFSPTISTHSSEMSLTTSFHKLSTDVSPSNKNDSTRIVNSNAHAPFRARPVPASMTEPSISPRMSKAAMLRLGLPWTPPSPRNANSTPPSNPNSSTPTAKNASSPPTVASLNPPLVQPRETKASKLRCHNKNTADEEEDPEIHKKIIKKTDLHIFEHTPGHGFRRANVVTNIPSIAPPKTEPRQTKASALRTGILDPNSFSSTTPTPTHTSTTGNRSQRSFESTVDSSLPVNLYEGVPGHKRIEKFMVEATKRPLIEPKMTKASLLRMNGSSSTNHNQDHQKKDTKSNLSNRPTSNNPIPLEDYNEPHEEEAEEELLRSTEDGYPARDRDEHVASPKFRRKPAARHSSSYAGFGSVVIMSKSK